MFTPKAVLRSSAVTAAVAAAVLGLGAGGAQAAGWPPLQPGAYLYTGTGGSGAVTTVDLNDFGTCHALSTPARSVQVANGSASVQLYPGAGCTGSYSWLSGSLAQSNLPFPAQSYRVVPA
ncbi:hypothetical protein [Streptomyces rubellomurinus]|uniref:Uncharacterized protein n=2 Tax=Streptomyces TaxID=1883 RepID=A0A0F2TK16_STRR3|nr:hypothetical protein [Streptomyces rubellomurinus]KJS52596.1 hypothetical protein VM98_30360 [Streptomyces rubellomurinus subsp. indigoferus]KJS62620.1 hypothetical protein VM95_07405 [Streptomyces rubellomurinus]